VTAENWAIWGSAVHAPVVGAVEILPRALMVVDREGSIQEMRPDVAADDLSLRQWRAEGRLTELGPHQMLLPGLVDLHVHAPQFPQAGTALDVPLEVWLQRHTFPLESRYADLDFATEVYGRLVETLLAHGTTTALYFGTIHLPATQRLAEICLARGQRALVGRVAMDHPEQCPPFYRDA
jgi:guanine deaminase